MSGRAHQRIPYVVRVEFRTASSFLVAYSVNLSRGGMFLESGQPAEIGKTVEMELAVPGAGPIRLSGRVTWRRLPEQADQGPPGMGLEFQGLDEVAGTIIDHLITRYRGISILLLAQNRHDRGSLTRLIRSVVSTAEVLDAGDATTAENMLKAQLDLFIIEMNHAGSVQLVQRAKRETPPLPVLALVSSLPERTQAKAAGADEVIGNPPQLAELQGALLRALGRPLRTG